MIKEEQNLNAENNYDDNTQNRNRTKITKWKLAAWPGGAPDGSEQGKRTVKFVVIVDDRYSAAEYDGQSCRWEFSFDRQIRFENHNYQ